MTIQDFYDFCLAKKGVTEHFPFDEDTLVFKVGGKVFALSSLSNWENNIPAVNLKCDPDRAEELREEYEGIKPGYHMSKKHWNTVAINSDVQPKLLQELITHSYELVYNSLTKKVRESI
ncbi:MmcQ/YjbR family DNA-binding protein [Flavobacterium sp. Sd200]|uniref:MmcQ/YjbR family DNA-binding protein n=1 Tax=Flavobacterium sp. Sd200 TaxID=2692211 RepID=UPI00136CA146|nr:MmcQ/YjbR family DNA-binding protein [Flavobacterium sp. Sd200]MXN92106.1 MmcQ/YjbR family DNA-binding protein [Flavobacterium sp. Sd200]